MREILLAKAYAAGKKDEFGGAKVLLAEVASRMLSDTSFNDLLELERYIAAVAQAVILIVESPGSICELGAFVMVPEISDKLIVILQGKYKSAPSFITDGAIKYFRRHQADAQIHGYDWEVDKDTRVVGAPDYATDAMLKEIPAAMRDVHDMHAKEKFRKGKLEHFIYLTLSFCHLLRAAKLIDIKRCFDYAKLDIDEITIKHSLDTLIICGLIEKVWQGKLPYHIAKVEKSPLSIRFLPSMSKSDRSQSRWQRRINNKIEKEENFRNEMFVSHRNG